MKKLLRAGENFGWLLAIAAVCIVAFAYFVARPPVEDVVDPDGPKVPVDLIDHATERAGMERGYQFGAEPASAFARPTFLPAYQFIQSPNFSGRGTCGLEAVTLHVTGPGSMAGMDSWFRNPASQVSAHFGIGKDGTVHQYVGLEAAAWHNGIVNLPDTSNPLIAKWKSTGMNPNRCTIGIELLLGGPAEPLTAFPAMQDSLSRLLTWLSATAGIPLDRVHVIGHYQVDALNRSTDPRCCLDIDVVLAQIVGPVPPSDWGECDLRFSDCWYIPFQVWVFPDGHWFDPETGRHSNEPGFLPLP